MENRSYVSEEEFLSEYDGTRFEKPSVAVDLLIFTIEDNKLKVLMVKRNNYPFRGCLSLPGVFVNINETLDEAAKRALRQKAGIENIYLEQLYTWGDIDRDPRMRIISVSYLALVPKIKIQSHEQTADSAGLISLDEISDEKNQIAFDHRKIISYARERIKNKVEYTNIAFEFLPQEFTLPELQIVYEILLGKKLYKANFRKKAASLIMPTDRMTTGDAHRPSRYYTLRKNGDE
ncbi:MAG: NUDIX domain-containing protein [Oscillospiraceae bacterium]|nr:NUDIX domain-containing protein [Oscillospiraceae bacterium]